MNLPTLLTLLRIAAVGVVVLLYILPVPWGHPVAAIVFLLAALTDWLDGYLARSLSMATRLGAFLDPVADKILVSVALVLVVGDQQAAYLSVPAAVIIGREVTISALREWMAEIGKRTSVAVSMLGKIKTILQMAALVMLLWDHPGSWVWLEGLGIVALYASAVLTLWSMIIYLRLAWPDLTEQI